MPQIISSPAELQQLCAQWKREGQTVGVVPTMGALHDGHLSLIENCNKNADRTVVTIFVNPTQFGPNEDFEKYPRDLEADIAKMGQLKVDVVFAPSPDQMYPPSCTTTVEPPAVSKSLEGELRPGHFQGVATVVLKLLNVSLADVAIFGQKDYQQLAVIRQMCTDLNVATKIISAPIVRESDGLAMSSRNRYLTESQREIATALSKALFSVSAEFRDGNHDARELAADLMQHLIDGGVDSVDYALIADAKTLEVVEEITEDAVALVAAYVGNTRLIDNCVLSPNP